MLWHVGVRYGILVCLFAVDCPLFCLYLYVFRNIIYINLGRPQYPLVPIAATACAIWTSVESIASVHFIPGAFSRRNGRSGLRLRGLTNFPLVTRARRASSRRNGRSGFRLGGSSCSGCLAVIHIGCTYSLYLIQLLSIPILARAPNRGRSVLPTEREERLPPRRASLPQAPCSRSQAQQLSLPLVLRTSSVGTEASVSMFSVLLWLFPYPAYSVRSRTFIVSYAPMLSELHHG